MKLSEKSDLKKGVHIVCHRVCKILGKADCNDYDYYFKDSRVIEEKERGEREGLLGAQKKFWQ